MLRRMLLIALVFASAFSSPSTPTGATIIGNFVAASNDSLNQIVVGGGGLIRFYDYQLKLTQTIFLDPDMLVGGLEYSHDQTKLAVVSGHPVLSGEAYNATLMVLDASTKKLIGKVTDLGLADTSLKITSIWSSDDTLFLSPSVSNTTVLNVQRSLQNGRMQSDMIVEQPVDTSAGTISGALFSPRSSKILINTYNRLTLVDFQSGVKTEYQSQSGFTDAVWSPDGRYIAMTEYSYSNKRSKTRILDTQTRQFGNVIEFDRSVGSQFWLPNTLITVLSDLKSGVGLDLRDNATFSRYLRIDGLKELPRQVISVSQGSYFLIVGSEGTIQLRDIRSGTVVAETVVSLTGNAAK